jgi:predicted dehydrogenase
VKIALAGLGGAANRGHLPAISRLTATGRVQLVAAADPSAERRLAAQREAPGLATFSSTAGMLESVESDLLVVATQPSAHSRLAMLGLQHRQHVLIEKPLALTSHDLRALREARVANSEFALVSVYQYQFSPVWTRILPWLRFANHLGTPFTLKVKVQRNGTDAKAASRWRVDSRSGGILADHGLHFLALAWRIGGGLRVVAGKRRPKPPGRESATALVRVGRSGLLELDLSANASNRRTRIEASALGARLVWDDAEATLAAAGKEFRHWEAEALSNRAHVDSLYHSIYCHLLDGVDNRRWRQRRIAETFSVADACVSLLARTEVEEGS